MFVLGPCGRNLRCIIILQLLLVSAIALAIIMSVALPLALRSHKPEESLSDRIFVGENDTVLSRPKLFDNKRVNVTESGEGHQVDLYVQECEEVKEQNETVSNTTNITAVIPGGHYQIKYPRYFNYAGKGSLLQYTIADVHNVSGPDGSTIDLCIFCNLETFQDSFDRNDCKKACFNHSFTVNKNVSDFSPVPFKVMSDGYYFQTVSVSHAMDFQIKFEANLVTYILPSNEAQHCQLKNSNDRCSFDLSADSCLLAYTHPLPEQDRQHGYLYLNIQD